MNIATGQVLTGMRKCPAVTDVLRFFTQIDATVPRQSTSCRTTYPHAAPQITTALAHRDRRRWRMYFTPGLQLLEKLIDRWLKEPTDKRVRGGRFTSVPEISEAITTWAQHRNDDPRPWIWKPTPNRSPPRSHAAERHSPDQINVGPLARLRLEATRALVDCTACRQDSPDALCSAAWRREAARK